MRHTFVAPGDSRSPPVADAIAVESARRTVITAVAVAAGGSSAHADEVCNDACLSDIFGKTSTGIEKLDAASERAIFFSLDEDTITYTYGTIKPKGVRAVLQRLQIDKNDVFTDVGSGVGNVVLQVFANTPVRLARGIEFVKARHANAVQYAESFKNKFRVDPAREISMVNGDACKEDYSDSTIVFANSKCFNERLLECLKASCESNPNLKYLITFGRLPNTKLRFLGDVSGLETSWASEGEQYSIYTNRPGVQL